MGCAARTGAGRAMPAGANPVAAGQCHRVTAPAPPCPRWRRPAPFEPCCAGCPAGPGLPASRPGRLGGKHHGTYPENHARCSCASGAGHAWPRSTGSGHCGPRPCRPFRRACHRHCRTSPAGPDATATRPCRAPAATRPEGKDEAYAPLGRWLPPRAPPCLLFASWTPCRVSCPKGLENRQSHGAKY